MAPQSYRHDWMQKRKAAVYDWFWCLNCFGRNPLTVTVHRITAEPNLTQSEPSGPEMERVMFPVLPYGASFLTRAFNSAFEPERNLGTHVEPLCNLSFFFLNFFVLSLSLSLYVSVYLCLSFSLCFVACSGKREINAFLLFRARYRVFTAVLRVFWMAHHNRKRALRNDKWRTRYQEFIGSGNSRWFQETIEKRSTLA